MKHDRLIIQADGGSRGNPGPAGYGAVVLSADTRQVLARRAGFLGTVTNNVAEYQGLIAGVEAAHAINPVATLLIELDSKLVVEQMRGAWKIKHADMQHFAMQARELTRGHVVEYRWIPRAENSLADALANKAMDERQDTVEDLWSQGPHSAESAVTKTTPAAAPPTSPYQGPVSTVYLIRHGHTPMTVAGEFSGSSDLGPELNQTGLQEVTAAANLVGRIHETGTFDAGVPFHQLVASPMIRTQQTAQAIAERTGLKIDTDPRLAEVHFGDWHGLTSPEIESRWPGQLVKWFQTGTFRAPGAGGESLQDVAERVWPAIQEIATEAAGKPTIIAAHSVVIRSAVGKALGTEPTSWARIRVLPGSLSVLRLGGAVPDVPIVGQLALPDRNL